MPAPQLLQPDPRVERTVTAILATAFELLIAHGPDGVTHGQVASAAKVSRTTVYNHFPTRAILLRATIETFGKPIPYELSGDVRTDLGLFLGHLVGDLADDDRACAIVAMMERAQHDTTVAEVRDEMVGQGFDIFAEIVRAGIEHRELRHDIDVDLAMASLIGVFFFRRFMVGRPIVGDEVAYIIDEFLANNAPR